MKKILLRALLFAVCLSLLILSFGSASVFSDEYNDAWILEYENMKSSVSAENKVPSLFRNDSPSANYARFPLVVQNNIHYAPVELFMGISGIKLRYGYSVSYFYLANEKQNKYISFDIEENLATTHEKSAFTLETKNFYNTVYLPVKEVAEVLGLKTEIYQSLFDGVYALRISDGKEKTSFSDLVNMYKPIKNNPDIQNPDISQNPGNIQIYMSFDLSHYNYITTILRSIEKSFPANSCVFFVRPDDILAYPDKIRQIFAYGQNVGFLLDGTNPKEELEKANENLRLVAKKTSRLVRFPKGSKNLSLEDETFDQFIKNTGACVWDYNISVGDSKTMYDTLYTRLYSLYSNYKTRKAVIRITTGSNTSSAISKTASLISGQKQLSLAAFNDAASPIYYR